MAKLPKSELPNVFEAKYKRRFSYRRLTVKKAFRGDLGLPRALNMYCLLYTSPSPRDD